MTEKKYYPLPKDTKAFSCAQCGAIALNANDICQVQGVEQKADWCGSKGLLPPKTCHTQAENERWQCRTCGQTAINNELLCAPAKMEFAL